ncbi:MAG: VTT domain-containing protein [DPANN group archaeon]|nr:VTT domain-containing protein [DPANN group archaeon]
MAERYEIIEEVSNSQNVKVLLVSILSLLLLIGLVFLVYSYKEALVVQHSYEGVKELFEEDLANFTPLGLLILSFVGGFFFIPLPIEVFFFNGLLNGNSPWVSLLFVVIGYLPAQFINYVIGNRFASLVLTIFSRKKVYKVKRWVNRFGPYAIFGFNILPLPSPLLTFALGIANYNLLRLFFWMILGTILKYMVIIGFHALF